MYELQCDSFDLIIIDPGLPGFDLMILIDRMTVIDRIIKAAPDSLCIVVTGSDSIPEAEALRERGVAGYLAKTGLKPGALGNIVKNIKMKGF